MNKDMTAEKAKELWEEAQKRARENFSDTYDVDDWEELDKYQREDCVHAEYKKLIKEQENEVNHFLSDAEKMRDFKELSKEEFLASYSYLTEAEYDNTAKEMAVEIQNFYDEFTDEPDPPVVSQILTEMEQRGVPAVLASYAEDISDWQNSFKDELSRNEIEASNDVIRFLSVPKTEFTLFEDLTDINDSMLFDSETVIAVLATPEGKEMSLKVRGEVRVSPYDNEGNANDETYRYYSEMPQDLKDAIKDGKLEEVAYVGNNNYFEVFYDDNDAFVDNCEVVDVENYSPAEIYGFMANMINQIEGRDVVPPTLEVYSITAENGQYLQEDNTLGAEETRSIFYDRNEAESTLEMLNDTREECYVLLTETPAGLEYDNQTVPLSSQKKEQTRKKSDKEHGDD